MGWLDGPVTTLATCWRIERRDGVTLGLTDHDRDLAVDGVLHRAAPGMTPAAVRRTAGLDPDGLEVAGALTAAAITEADLLAGRWDGARVRLFAVDWTDTTHRVALGEGTIGAVEWRAGGFQAELAGPAAALAGAVVEATSPGCRATLGDRRCRVPMAGRRRFARVVAAEPTRLTLDRAEPAPGAYNHGLLRWFGGANGGLEGAVAASAGATVTLRMPPPYAAEPGALVELVEGCDGTLATCAGRFGNAANFRGEPFLPGVDLLTRYPGA
jgi:uncharacterized phage protein (TIGR02218 family)